MVFYKKTYFVCLFCFYFSLLNAQEKRDSLIYLEEVQLKQTSFKEITPSQKLSGVELEKLNSHSVADALRYFAGVQIKDYGGMGGLKTVNIRNMGSQHVGVFYNGIQLGNAQNGIVDLGKYALDDLEEISLYNGQTSDIFQSAKDFASASTIYLKSREPKFEKGKQTNLLLRYKTGSIQLINPSFRLEQKLNEQFSFRLSSEYMYSNGRYKFRLSKKNNDGSMAYDTTAIRKNSDIEVKRLEAALIGKLKKGSWNTNIYYYDSERGLPGAVIRNKFYRRHRLTDRNFFIQSNFEQNISAKYKFQLKAKFASDYTYFLARDSVKIGEEEDFHTDGQRFDNKYYQKEFYFSFSNIYQILSNWNISLATDFQYNKLDASLRGVGTAFTFPRRYTNLSALASTIELGKFKLQGSVVGNFITETVKNNVKAPDRSVFTPAFFMSYKPFKSIDLNTRLFYKRIFRMPTFNDLYYTELGYSLLKPEFANQYNIGLSYNKIFKNDFLQSIHFQVDAYHLSITDKIISAPTGSQFRWMMSNIGKVEGQGMDVVLNLQGKLNKIHLGANVNYAYASIKNRDKKINNLIGSAYGDQIPYTPWHSGSLTLNGEYKQWGINYSFIYVGERYDANNNNIIENYIQPWYTHDFSIQKTIQFRKYVIKASAEINNTFDQFYEVVKNYPMPGRHFKFILNIEL